MNKRIRSFLSLAISLFIVTACSSGNPTTPNKEQLKNLAKAPSTTPDNDNVKKINLSGRVLDSVTRKPLENASVLVYVISNDEIIKSVKNAATSQPSPSASANPAPSASPVNVPPSENPVTPVNPVTAPPKPISSVEENEEKSSPLPKPSLPVKPLTTGKPFQSPLPAPSEEPEKPTEPELSDKDLVTALSNIKINDIQEFKASTGNDGKFWINKMPDTNVIITVSANNYRAVSVFAADTSKVEDILLEPLNDSEYVTFVKGNVISATNKTVENAVVSPSYQTSNPYGVPGSSDKDGNFLLEGISTGERTFLATVKDNSGRIVSMGTTDFEVKKSKEAEELKKKQEEKEKLKDSLDSKKSEISDKKTTNSENEEETAKKEVLSPEDKETVEEKKPDNIKKEPVKDSKKDKEHLVIKIKSVTEYIDIKGKITLPEGTTLKSINAYMVFKKKGQPREEFFVTGENIQDKSDSFEMSLPKPESGYYYHIEFVAVNKKGSYIYHHEHNLKKDTKDMKIGFISPMNVARADFVDRDGEKIPIFTWTPVEGVGFYKIYLNKVDKDNNIVNIWNGITPFNSAIYPITTGSAKLSGSNSYYWSVVAIKETSEKTVADKLLFSKLNLSLWSDLASLPEMEFKLSGTEEIEEIDSENTKKED